MTRKIYATIFIFTLLILLSLTFVSANVIGDFLNKITGRAVSAYSCNDSDGGVNIYVKGTINSIDNEGKFFVHSDWCIPQNDSAYQLFAGYLEENYCGEDQKADVKMINCTYGCKDGACINIINNPRCVSHDHTICDNGNLVWVNNCNQIEDIKEICSNGCSNGACANNTQTNNSYQLNSDFFKNDLTANLIISGKDYQLIDNNLYTSDWKINTSSFEFKFINAFKQMGFVMINSQPTTLFHKWLSKHGYSAVNIINRDILIKIDSELKKREILDESLVGFYEPFSKFLDGPINEPKKEHVAQIYYSFFNSLPAGIKTETRFGPMTSAQIDDNFLSTKYLMFFIATWQVQDVFGDLLTENTLLPLDSDEAVVLSQNKDYSFKFCTENYYTNLDSGNKCGERTFPNQLLSDIQYVYPVIHEFGHGVGNYKSDSNDYLTQLDMEFGRISFNFTENPDIIYPGHPLRPNNNHEFISEYAKKTHAEDFTESFTAYILEGRIFRERIKSDAYLEQKYEFLKDNIFNGTEYETGNVSSLELWNNQNNDKLPASVEVYLASDPDLVWDYNYPNSQNTAIPPINQIPPVGSGPWQAIVRFFKELFA